MKTLRSLLVLFALSRPVIATDYTESTLVKVGDLAPAFSVTTTENEEIATEKLRGKIIVVNFFATWCGPCVAELPHLDKEVWQRFKDRGVKIVALGREHSGEEVGKFRAEKKLTLPMAGDPGRKIYAKYATQYIPRNFVIGADGKVAFQSVGFDQADLQKMIAAIEAELGRVK
jgi:peroxiredoxin